MKITKQHIWLAVLALLFLLVAFAFFNSQRQNGLNSRPEINFNDPNVIEIVQGSEGEIHTLEIGVAFVGNDRANLSIYDNAVPDVDAAMAEYSVGSSTNLNNYFIIVLEIDPAAESVVLEVLPN